MYGITGFEVNENCLLLSTESGPQKDHDFERFASQNVSIFLNSFLEPQTSPNLPYLENFASYSASMVL